MISGFRFYGVLIVVFAAYGYYTMPLAVAPLELWPFLVPDLLVAFVWTIAVLGLFKRKRDIAPPAWMLFLFAALPFLPYDLLRVLPSLGLAAWSPYLKFAALIVPLAFVMFVDARVRRLNRGPKGPWGRRPATA